MMSQVPVMENPNQPNVRIELSPDAKRERLGVLKAEVASLQRLASKETDVARQQDLAARVASHNREVAVLMRELGLSTVFKEKPEREARRKFLPTQELTVDQLLTLAAAGKSTPEGAAALTKLREVPGVMKIIAPWVPPPFPPSPDAQSVAAYMAGCKTFKPIQAVLRCVKDPYFKPAGGLKNLATVTQPPQYVGQDAEWIALLQQVPAEYAGERSEVLRCLERAVAGYYVASGPIEGWLARLKKGDARPHPNFVLTEKELQAVYRVLPWAAERAPNFAKASLLDLLKQVRINGAAGAGMPRHKKKAVVMKELLEDAVQYYSLLQKKEFNAYAQLHPGEFLTICKMKLDRYEAEDWGKKVRPYYNLNGGLALIFSCVVQAYSGCLVPFWENPESCNAHGFSWNSGGGDRLYAWVKWVASQPPGLYAIGYSDDGLWAIKTKSGDVFVSDRDIAQCDSSCGNAFLPPYRAHLIAVLEKVLNDPWRNVTLASASSIWKQVVILYKSLCFLSDNKVHSGVPGTAEADQVAFAVLYTLLQVEFTKLYAARDGGAWELCFNEAVKLVSSRIGLEFKEAQWYQFEEDQEEYPWEFLGKRLVKFRGHYIPVVTMEKAVVQLVTPKSNRSGLDGQRAWMERARGLAVTSLFWHPVLFDLAKKAYNRKLESGVKPAATMDGEEVGESDLEQILGQGVQVTFSDVKFPSREWVFSLYLGVQAPTEEAEEKIAVLSPVQSAADIFSDFFAEPEAPPPSAKWAETEPPNPTREAAKLPLKEAPRIKELPVTPTTAGTGYQMAPLPQAVKDAYHQARRDAFRAMAEATGGKRKGQYQRGGAVEKMLFNPAEHVVFTREGIRTAWENAVAADEFTVQYEVDDDDAWAFYHPADLETDEEAQRRLEAVEDQRQEEFYARYLKGGKGASLVH